MRKSVGGRVSFSSVLRAFQVGGITYQDLIGRVEDDLVAGVLAADLLDALRSREFVEPLPEEVYNEVFSRLTRNSRLQPAVAEAST